MATTSKVPAGSIQVYTIYQNILAMLEHRGFVLMSQLESPTTFSKRYYSSNYMTINASHPSGRTIVVILAYMDWGNHKIDAEVRTLIGQVLKSAPSEVMYITDIDFVGGLTPSMLQKIRDLISSGGSSTWVQVRSYDNFRMNALTSQMVLPHEIVPPSEYGTELNFSRLSESAIPRINEYDTPVVWEGGKPGDIIKVTRASPITGSSIVYRKVIAI